jgi:Helix-turn-helix domain
MKLHRWEDVKKRRPLTAKQTQQGEKWVQEQILKLNLQALRKHLGKTQAQIADAAKMTQSELSRAEQRADHLVSTLRRIVTAMGGELKLTAVFDDVEIRLSGV